ncbi:MAG: hypothetical protein Q9221_003838 [Calogaya cf. arnoldii]
MRYGWALIISGWTVLLLCFADAVAATGSGVADYNCQCTLSNNAAITSSVTSCLPESECTIQDLSKIQQFGQTFCPSVRASQSTTQARTTTASTSPRESSEASTSSQSTVATSRIQQTPQPSPTTSASNLLGAGIPGTNWKPVHNSPNTNRGPAIEAVCITLLIIAASVVAFRIYARLKTRQLRQVAQGLGWDEFFACFVLVLVGGIVATVIVGVKYGMGKHQDHQTSAQIVKIIQVIYSFTLIIVLSFGSLKVSILCLYLRMTPERSHRITLYCLIGVVVVNMIAVLFVRNPTGSILWSIANPDKKTNIFLCTPIADFWTLDRIIANKMRHREQDALHRYRLDGYIHKLMECFRRSHRLGTANPRPLQAEGTDRKKDWSLHPHWNQFYVGRLRYQSGQRLRDLD